MNRTHFMHRQTSKARTTIVFLFVGWLSLLSLHAADAPVKVVCFGDSITKSVHQKGDLTYPAQLGKKLGAEVINAGVGGNTTSAGLARMEKDVLAHKPDAVVILFGTNDSVLTGPKKFRTPLADYKANLLKMVDRCRQQNAKIILCTIPPINPEPYFQRHPKEAYDAEGGLETILDRYRKIVAEIARTQKIPIVDLATRLDKTKALSPDGVHMTDEGSELIAELVAATLKPELKKAQ